MTKYNNEQLNQMSVNELKDIVKNEYSNVTIKGLWKMTKSNIIENIESLQSDQNEKIKKDDKKLKYIYKAFNESDELKFTTSKLSELTNYAMKNHICNRGWVLISINKNVRVTMRIKKNQSYEEYKKNAKTTSKYHGNFWKFTKEEA